MQVVDYNQSPDVGQMLPSERQALHEKVLATKPGIVCEVGTWKGGGSTFFIASAMVRNRLGHLHTIEIDPELHATAVHEYDTAWLWLQSAVTFHLGNSLEIFPTVLAEVGQVDGLMLDGKEDSDQTVLEFQMFLPYLTPTAWVACHDWNCGKMTAMRDILTPANGWEPETVITDTSTGFAILQRVP